VSGFDRDLNSFVQAYDSKRLEPPAYDTMDGWGRPVLHDRDKSVKEGDD
jgi:hypothetical protein